MAVDVIIPADLWEDDEEAVITNWLADDGDSVDEGALLAEIMSGKAQFEIRAPASGVLRVAQAAEAVVAKGAVIGTIE